MAGRVRNGTRRRVPSDVMRDIRGEIERLTEGITVTDASRAGDTAAPMTAAVFAPIRPWAAPPVEIADDIDPLSRPWTPAAAREPLPPVSPRELSDLLGAGQEQAHRSRLMTAAVAVASVAAIFVVVASHLDLAHTAMPSFAVNELSVTKDPADTTVTVAGHFPATAPQIDIDAAYIGAVQGDRLTIQVLFADGIFAEHTYDLSPGSGTVPAPLTPKSSARFKAGLYTVNAIWHGTVVRTAQFTVDAPTPGTAPPPSG